MTQVALPAHEFDFPLVPGSVKGAMKTADAKSRDLWQVAPAQIKLIPGFNVREKDDEYAAHVRSIADSIKSEGFKQHKPLAGYVANEEGENVIYIYDGHCRFEATNIAISEGAEITAIPVVVSIGASLEDLTVELVRSNEGRPLKPIEKAVVCKRLSGYGMNQSEIARRLGITSQYVADLLYLIAAPSPIRKMVSNNEVSARTAIQTMKKSGSKAVEQLTSAKAAVETSGKKKVTNKHVVPVLTGYEKYVKKNAVRIANVLVSALYDGEALNADGKALLEELGKLRDASEL